MDVASLIDCVAPLFVPGDRPHLFAKAAASEADAIILDLEDAVAPAAKADARSALSTTFTDLPVIVRINALGTTWFADDLEAVLSLPIAAVMLPKADLQATSETVIAFGGAFPVIALVETARGLSEARQVASMPGVDRLAFGSIDFAADLGADHGREALLSARHELVFASRLGSLSAPLDGVTVSLTDIDGIQSDAHHARSLGFGGKLCIHPAQVKPVISGFEPSAKEVDWARRVIACGDGVATLDGTMIDPPVKARAYAVLLRLRRSATSA